MTVDNIQPKIKKQVKQKSKLMQDIQKKTYKNRTICIKLKDIDAIDAFLNSRNQSATQYFYSCLKRDGVIE